MEALNCLRYLSNKEVLSDKYGMMTRQNACDEGSLIYAVENDYSFMNLIYRVSHWSANRR